MKTILTSIALLSGIVAFAQETQKKDTVKTENIQEVIVTKKVITKNLTVWFLMFLLLRLPREIRPLIC